jgi:hypothetical protein
MLLGLLAHALVHEAVVWGFVREDGFSGAAEPCAAY